MPTGDFADEAAFREQMGLSPYQGISDPFAAVSTPPPRSSAYAPLLENVGADTGVDADYLARIMKIESGGDPNNRTGSYRGLFQLSPSEFAKYGGTGDIYDPEQNARAAANKTAAEAQAFQDKYGRAPTSTDLYMTHQQGQGGYANHIAAPDAPAWQNMYATAEGQQKGPAWAKQAIWGNIPDNLKPRFGSVNNVTSQDLIDIYARKLGYGADRLPLAFGPTGSPPGLPEQADPNAPEGGSPAGNPMQADELAQAVARAQSGGGATEVSAQRRMPGQAGAPAGPPTAPAGNLPFGIPGTAFNNPVQQALGDNFSTLLGFAGGARQGGIGQGLTQAAKASLVADQQRSLDLQRTQDMAWKRFEAARAQANTDRAFGLTAKQFEEGKLPSGYTKDKEGNLTFTKGGPADPVVIRAQSEAKVGGGLLDAPTIEQMAEQYRSGDTSVLTNLGRGAQGAENIKLLRTEIVRQNTAAGTSGAAQAQTNAEMQGERSFQRALGTRQAGVTVPAAEFEQMAPIARELSAKVDRTQYPTLNSLILAAEKGTGSEDAIRYGAALKSLSNIYSRVISPTGASTDQTRATAYGLLDTAYSDGQVNAAIDVMDREIQAAKKGTQQAQKEHRQQRTAPAAPVAPVAPVAPTTTVVPTAAEPPASAIQFLRVNPGRAKDFDAKYGPGAAARALGNNM